jgi:hypothetical protein
LDTGIDCSSHGIATMHGVGNYLPLSAAWEYMGMRNP